MVGKFHDSSAVPEEVKKAVLLHHERVDGSGYPFNTMAKDINFFARIVSVADVFDAMTSDRVYKKRSSLSMLLKCLKQLALVFLI